MRTRHKVVLICVFALFVAAGLVLLCAGALRLVDSWEHRIAYYPSYETADKDGMIEKGWIPDFVPSSASEIQEQHCLDTNDVWIRFLVPNADRERMVCGLPRLTEDEMRDLDPEQPHRRVDWWFDDFIQRSPENLQGLDADVYLMKADGGRWPGYLALDRGSEKIYCWREAMR